jgi:hypothetical protein
MSEIINLRQARKQKERASKEAAAGANRLTHGRAKQEKNLTKAQREAEQSKLDGHKRVKQQAEDE